MQSAKTGKHLVIVGDRVLIAPDDGEEKLDSGLFLPATHVQELAVRSGKVIECGPGSPMGTSMTSGEDGESWRPQAREKPRYFPMQPKVGDTALFFRRAAVEIKFEEKPYLIVPEGAILALIRDGKPVTPDALPDDIG